jgi:hypothetical protein
MKKTNIEALCTLAVSLILLLIFYSLPMESKHNYYVSKIPIAAWGLVAAVAIRFILIAWAINNKTSTINDGTKNRIDRIYYTSIIVIAISFTWALIYHPIILPIHHLLGL